MSCVVRVSVRIYITLQMNSEVYDWNAVLNDHPILSLPKSSDEQTNSKKGVLELSLNSLPHFTHVDPEEDGPTPSGRRQVMILKDADLILAVGKDIRITSLVDSKLSAKSYKGSNAIRPIPCNI